MEAASTEDIRAKQREALWKWRWLGLRESTPAFKASIFVLALAAVALAVWMAASPRF